MTNQDAPGTLSIYAHSDITESISCEPGYNGLTDDWNYDVNDNDKLKNADKFDALVDYYQMCLQIMIEGILKGYGYDTLPQNSKDYQNIKMIEFYKN